ncbi:MAG: VCBS repeat-containing protein [Phycisphaerales bacterium]
MPDPGDFQAPAVPALGPETIQVVARVGGGADVILLNGAGIGDDVVLDGGGFPLIVALKNAVPGSEPVIGIYGRIPQGGNGMQIGAGDSDNKAYVAHWGSVPMRFSVVGMTPDATILELGILNRMNDGTVHGGVQDARFENLTIEAKYNSCVSGPKGHQFGLLRFYNCRFVPSPANLASGAHYGFGYKWGVRIRALGRYDFRDCTFAPVLEHSIYVDSPQGDSIFKGIVHEGSTRTAIQIVNRAFDTTNTAPFENGTQIPQPSGYGRILIEDVTIHDLTGDGGSGITVAGFLGDVWIRDITAIDNGPFQGVITVWTDAGWNHGAYLYTGDDGGLYSQRSVTLEDIHVDLPQSDRDHVAISGVELVRIHDFSIAGNRTAFSLDSVYGAAQLSNSLCVIDGVVARSNALIVNGTVDFYVERPLSQYGGWNSNGKIKVGTNTLSNAQIDSTWPNMPDAGGADPGDNMIWLMNGLTMSDTVELPAVADANWVPAAMVDLTGDGTTDVFWRNEATGADLIWALDGLNTPITGLTLTAGTVWHVVGSGDFDGDGLGDVLWHHQTLGTVVIWFSNGSSISGWGVVTSVPDLNWAIVATNDFDGDGLTDILWRNTTTGGNIVWLMNGSTLTSWGSLPGVADTNWSMADTGDFDGNGTADLLWRNLATGQNIVWWLNGTSFTGWNTIQAIGDLSWKAAGTGDFNGDGTTDLLWRHAVTGLTVIWMLNGPAILQSGVIGVMATDWNVAGVGDFNGDGFADIMWRHTY